MIKEINLIYVKGAIDLINFSENGYTLALGSSIEKIVKIFDLRKAKCVKTLFGVEDDFALTSFEFDLSGGVFAAGNAQGQIKLFETKKWSLLSTLHIHTSSVRALK